MQLFAINVVYECAQGEGHLKDSSRLPCHRPKSPQAKRYRIPSHPFVTCPPTTCPSRFPACKRISPAPPRPGRISPARRGAHPEPLPAGVSPLQCVFSSFLVVSCICGDNSNPTSPSILRFPFQPFPQPHRRISSQPFCASSSMESYPPVRSSSRIVRITEVRSTE